MFNPWSFASNSGKSTTASITFVAAPADPQAGDLLVVTAICSGGTFTAGSGTAGWNEALIDNSGSCKQAIYWKKADGTETAFSVSKTGNSPWAIAYEEFYSTVDGGGNPSGGYGLLYVDFDDFANSGASTTTTQTNGTNGQTTLEDGELPIALWGCASGALNPQTGGAPGGDYRFVNVNTVQTGAQLAQYDVGTSTWVNGVPIGYDPHRTYTGISPAGLAAGSVITFIDPVSMGLFTAHPTPPRDPRLRWRRAPLLAAGVAPNPEPGRFSERTSKLPLWRRQAPALLAGEAAQLPAAPLIVLAATTIKRRFAPRPRRQQVAVLGVDATVPSPARRARALLRRASPRRDLIVSDQSLPTGGRLPRRPWPRRARAKIEPTWFQSAVPPYQFVLLGWSRARRVVAWVRRARASQPLAAEPLSPSPAVRRRAVRARRATRYDASAQQVVAGQPLAGRWRRQSAPSVPRRKTDSPWITVSVAVVPLLTTWWTRVLRARPGGSRRARRFETVQAQVNPPYATWPARLRRAVGFGRRRERPALAVPAEPILSRSRRERYRLAMLTLRRAASLRSAQAEPIPTRRRIRLAPALRRASRRDPPLGASLPATTLAPIWRRVRRPIGWLGRRLRLTPWGSQLGSPGTVVAVDRLAFSTMATDAAGATVAATDALSGSVAALDRARGVVVATDRLAGAAMAVDHN